VVGGLFIKMLTDPEIWKKWASGDTAKVGDWAPLPTPPTVTEVVPTSRQEPIIWRYTIEKPSANWAAPDFDDSGWTQGPAGFGARGTPNAVINTKWKSDDIWIRREFTMPEGKFDNLQLLVDHDDDAEIYVNGVVAAKERGFTNGYVPMTMGHAALDQLKPGAKIVLAAHCHQFKGGQAIDIGLANVVESQP